QVQTSDKDLQKFDPTITDMQQLVERAKEGEAAALTIAGINLPATASASFSLGSVCHRASNGLYRYSTNSFHGQSVLAFAEKNGAMERDWAQSGACWLEDLRSIQDIADEAANRAISRLGAKKGPGGTMAVMFEPRTARTLINMLLGAISGSSVARGVSFLKDKKGQQLFANSFNIIEDPHRLRGSGSSLIDSEGFLRKPAAIIENAKTIQNMKTQSITDELTKLYNHRYFHDTAGKWVKDKKYETFSVAMIDIDQFKIYNDLYGHSAGDIALKKIAEIIGEATSKNDLLVRYGGEEFVIFYPNIEGMAALKEMTKRFSSEGSIRYFIEKYPEKTLETFAQWVTDESAHVRRLVSEGTRPRLPMMMALAEFKKDPSPIIPFLEKLKNDPELFVRRSVANSLNDIAKDNPNIVTELLARWNKDKSPEMQWLIKHALRTLEKQGDLATLEILGFSSNPKVEIKLFELSKNKVVFGDFLTMELQINSKCNKSSEVENLLIDYVVYHKKANGKLAPKVFKWCKKKLAYGEKLSLTKKHVFKPISTRKYYPGNHEIHIQINGHILSKCCFELRMQ
ncbi:MAG: metallopeptidase TldD-related protein, partial [Kangiellaceae bacterium]|nr:metallopeptidase TldD-related protein [Kangiellaceae bacterium]